MLHRKTIASWMVFVVVMVAFGTNQATADVSIREFTLARHGAFTELTVRTPGRVLCNHFTEEPKFDKPFRVVLDLCGAVHELDRKVFEDLPPGVITRIRTSQYATTPQNVVRVVLDLTHDVTYKVVTDENSFTISLVAPDEPDFEIWSSSGTLEKPETARPAVMASAAQPATTPTVKKQPPVEGPPSTQAEPALEVAHGPYEESFPTKFATKPGKEMSPTKTAAQPAPSVTKKADPVQQEQPTVAEAQSDGGGPTSAKSEPERPTAREKTNEYVSAEPEVRAKPETTTETTESRFLIPLAQYGSPAGPEWSAPTPENAGVEEKPANQTVAVESPNQMTPGQENVQETLPEVALQSPQVGTGEPSSSEVEAPTAEEEKQPLITQLRSKFFGSPDEEKLASDQPIDSVSLNRIRALAALEDHQTGETAPEIEGAPQRHIDREELESKIASVDPSVIPAGGTAYADAERPGETVESVDGKGTPVQVEPERESVKYDRAGRRDPFDPLVEGQRSGLWTAALPRVDALRLVGILQDYDGSIALFEDMEGYGYILREGDPVKNGYLKSVSDDRVVFEVDDYGWIHTLVLELRDESSNAGFGYAKDLLEE